MLNTNLLRWGHTPASEAKQFGHLPVQKILEEYIKEEEMPTRDIPAGSNATNGTTKPSTNGPTTGHKSATNGPTNGLVNDQTKNSINEAITEAMGKVNIFPTNL